MDPEYSPESGVLLVDKPEDWTSHDVVNCVRRRFKVKKVGHCGTLDPIATGLLILVLGKATKLSDRFRDHDKVYSGVMRLGAETSSQDREGEVISTCDSVDFTDDKIRAEAANFEGEQEQVPPMVSAVKVNGKKLYELARQGKEVERQARNVMVHELTIEKIALPDVWFRLHCSKGTYVRTICADLGRRLGCGAYVQRLRRLQSGPFQVDDGVSMEEVKQWERDDLLKALIPLPQVLNQLV